MDKARSNPLKVACCILFIYAEKEISVFPFAKLSICMKFYLSQVLSHIWSYLDSQIKEFPSSSSAPISWKGARNYFILKKKKKTLKGILNLPFIILWRQTQQELKLTLKGAVGIFIFYFFLTRFCQRFFQVFCQRFLLKIHFGPFSLKFLLWGTKVHVFMF